VRTVRLGWITAIVCGAVLGLCFAMAAGELGETIFSSGGL
jgi:hypothetical protein